MLSVYVIDTLIANTRPAITSYGTSLRMRELTLWEARWLLRRSSWRSRVLTKENAAAMGDLLDVEMDQCNAPVELDGGDVLLLGMRSGPRERHVRWLAIEIPGGGCH